MAQSVVDKAFQDWFNAVGNAMIHLEVPFYAGWNARQKEIDQLQMDYELSVKIAEYHANEADQLRVELDGVRKTNKRMADHIVAGTP